MIGLDTNVLVRYLAQDDEAESALATALIETHLSHEQPGYVSAAVLAELHWILARLYGVDRPHFADIARGLLTAHTLRFDNLQAAWNALQAFEDGLDFVDALLAELAHDAGCKTTVTFDKGLAEHPKASLLIAER
jgi:predicted nucleic-acid-binding protein